MFCPECGTWLDEDARFCPECGTKVMFEEPAAAAETPVVEVVNEDLLCAQMAGNLCAMDAANTTCKITSRGFILTNLRTLSKRLAVDVEDLQGMFMGYIGRMQHLGVAYTLLDAGDYTYKAKGFLSGHKHVSLGPTDAWYDYADILKDAHDAEVRSRLPESDYLFIIGGDQDVPMATVPNIFCDADRDVDTDLLYAYPYGKEMEEKLLSLELFSYDALFYVGRLPVADDGSLQDIESYLVRVLESRATVPIDRAYTQSDPAWYPLTLAITESLDECGFYPPLSSNTPQGSAVGGRVYLTPNIVVNDDTGEELFHVFDADANYYFFNMHGSDAMTSACFYGKIPTEGPCLPGISPSQIRQARRPNIIFTQACYGGRFIGYPKHLSMLLTALSSNTMVYVGSSRVAIGGATPNGAVSSDILGNAFNNYVLSGSTVGSAFFSARVQTFLHSRGSIPDDVLAVVEFNLYGDPVIHRGGYELDCGADKRAILAKGERVGVVRHEVLYEKSMGVQQSLLAQVRQAVDKNIMDISATITKYLYEQYGVSAREPSVIRRNIFADGHKELSFTYSNPLNNGIVDDTYVTTSERGEIQHVVMTK